jgi:hypothetical protein
VVFDEHLAKKLLDFGGDVVDVTGERHSALLQQGQQLGDRFLLEWAETEQHLV